MPLFWGLILAMVSSAGGLMLACSRPTRGMADLSTAIVPKEGEAAAPAETNLPELPTATPTKSTVTRASEHHQQAEAHRGPKAATSEITTLVTKHGTLRIYGPDSFAVVAVDGKRTTEELNQAGLAARFPELHRAYRDAEAVTSLDASLDLESSE